MLAIIAAVIIFLSKAVGALDDTADFSWFWLGASLFVLHFGFDWAVATYRSHRGQ
jgi:hypothetical protein